MIEQGTDDWLKLRKGKITASKIAVIMGLSPYQTPKMLWEEELGFREAQKASSHMQRGLDIEDDAREYFKQQTGVEVSPAVIFRKGHPKFMASLDGLSADELTMVEIKNNNMSYHDMAKKGLIVEFHQCQMQWQMYVSGDEIEKSNYLSYRNADDAVIVPLSRDEGYIQKQVEAGLQFLKYIEDLEEPPLMEADYEDVSKNSALQQAVNEYREYNALIKHYTELSESAKKRIISESKDRNVRGLDWKMTKYEQKGRVNYDELLKDLDVKDDDLTAYRKESKTSYRITLQ